MRSRSPLRAVILSWDGNSGASRTLEVTTTGIGTVSVRVRCTAPGYVSGSAAADFVTGGVPDRCSADLGTLGAGTVARSGQIAAVSECTSWQLGTAAVPHYARRFTLGVASPSSVTVAASSAVVDVYLYVLEGSGASAVVVGSDDDGGPGTDALVSGAALQPDRSYVVEVTTAAPRSVGAFSLSVAVTPDIETVGDVCNDPLGTLREGATSRSGTIAADAACTSAQRRANPGSSVYHARRHTLSLSADATVTIDLADSATDAETLDPYLILLGGHNAGTGRVLHADDGGDTANDSRISAVALAAGTYTIEATSYGSRDHGDYSLEVAVDYVDRVEIMGLDDSTESGSGTVTVTDRFAVAPPGAACTAAPVGEIAADPGGGAGGRVLSVEFAGPGTAAVTVTCTAAGRGSAQAEVEFVAEGSVSVSVSGDACSAASPVPAGADRAYRCVLSDEHRLTLTATADAGSRDISIGWAAGPGLRVVSHSADAVVPLTGPDGSIAGRWSRTAAAAVGCTATAVRTLTLAVTVGRGGDAVVHTSSVSVDCQEQGTISGLADTAEAGTGTVTVSDSFAVAPASARCTASSTAGTATVAEGAGGERTLSVGLAVAPGSDASASVSVECTPPGHAPVTATATFAAAYGDRCDSPLGVLADGVTARAGIITADAMCTSSQRTTSSAVYYARRHSFELANPGVVTIDLEETASISTTLDTYVLLLEGSGHGGTGTVLGRNDDRVSGETDSRIADKTLAPGRYTIEATTYAARRTGRCTLTVTAQLEVLIEGLDGAARIGTGTARDHFTVTPADANCTTDVGAVTAVGGTGRRTLAAELAALGDTTATVRCTRTGYTAATATATLSALAPVSDVSLRADSGGTCRLFAGALGVGVDQKYVCTMTRGDALAATADAIGPSAWLSLGWSAADGVGAVGGTQSFDSAIAAGSVRFTHTGTAGITCTADADVTLAVSHRGTVEHTTVVSVTCVPPVEIANYSPGSRNGAGAMTGTFEVAPATADCTARNVGGIAGRPTAEGDGTHRTVPVTTTGTGWLDIEVECSNAGYATSAATARFRADDDAVCTTDLGTLSHGTRTESGTLAQDLVRLRCKSFRRDTADPQSTYYVRRYTFVMATSGWVSVGLDATGSGFSEIDPYLLVLYGHGSGGAERARDDDSGAGDNAQLTDLFLAAGNYTIEATTAAAGDSGTYRLSVDADFAAQAPDQPGRIDARVGQAISRAWGYLPAAAATVQSVTPTGLTAAVTADRGNATLAAAATHAGDYTVTVAYTASGHTSTIETNVIILCPPRHVTTTSRTCTPLATALPAGCTVTSLNTNGYWGPNTAIERYSAYSTQAPAECDSLSESGAAAYFRFTVPERPGRLPVRAVVDSAEPRGGPLEVAADGGDPSVTLWRETQSSLSFKAHGTVRSSKGLFVETDLTPGRYVIEVAPSRAVRRPNDRFSVTAMVPTAERTHADVQNVGNTGLGDAGMSLGQFLDARGSLIYGAHPDADPNRAADPFYPESRDYPWLPFTTDRCSIPPAWILHLAENTVDEAAIRLGPLTWLAAHLLLPDADEIADHPQFGGETVAFVYGCMRHDFNWRNLHRVKHHYQYDTPSGTWNGTVREDADTRLGTDLVALCKANQDAAPESSTHYTWELPNQGAIDRCETAANAIKRALGAVPFGWIGYDHD